MSLDEILAGIVDRLWAYPHIKKNYQDLSKILYYSQAWYLAENNRKLFNGDFAAYSQGPTSLEFWKDYCDNPWKEIKLKAAVYLNTHESIAIDRALHMFSKTRPNFQEEHTKPGSPWKTTRGNLDTGSQCWKIISPVLIRNYYGFKLGKDYSKANNLVS